MPQLFLNEEEESENDLIFGAGNQRNISAMSTEVLKTL